MAKKLNEMQTYELMAALVELAEPVGNLADDDEFWDRFRDCTKKAWKLQQRDGLRFLVKTYAELGSLLFGEKHKHDIVKIFSIVAGKTIKETMEMNGAEMFSEFVKVYKEKLEPFFIKSALSEKIE